MKKIIKYECEYCGESFYSEEICLEHEDRHARTNKANQMLNKGRTLKEIQDACDIWHNLPEYLYDVTKDNCFKIPHWQRCEKPAYRIVHIDINEQVNVGGCGSQKGYYDNYLQINSGNLRDPRPKEELYIDPRYQR